jgi:tRNA(Arg) A34 adenosine deaminase TadA
VSEDADPTVGLITEADERHLRREIELAIRARSRGDQPYGSLLAGPEGAVLAEEGNTVLTYHDITAHPELKLARWAARQLDSDRPRRTTLYTSCEPCPMCANAIARAGIGRVMFALSAEQLQRLKPPGSVPPGATEVGYQGPALFDEARVPIDGYYSS